MPSGHDIDGQPARGLARPDRRSHAAHPESRARTYEVSEALDVVVPDLAKHAADAGFPSDHATASMAIAVAFLLRRRFFGGR